MMQKPGALVLGFVVFVLAIGAMDGEIRVAKSAPELPIRNVNVTIAKSAREEFVSQIRIFADTYAFAIRVSQSSPNPDDVLVQMWRVDAKLISGNASDTAAQELTYTISIYENGDHPIPMKAVTQLVEGLRDTVGQIADTTFIITK